MSIKHKKSILFIILALSACLSVHSAGRSDQLFNIVETGEPEAAKKIIKKNKDSINVRRGKDKETLLMAAVKKNRDTAMIELLLKYGADPTLKDKNGATAIMWSAEYTSDPKVLEQLVKHNAPFSFTRKNRITKKDKSGNTAFDYARLNKNPKPILSALEKICPEPQKKEKPVKNSDKAEENIEQEQSETESKTLNEKQEISNQEDLVENKEQQSDEQKNQSTEAENDKDKNSLPQNTEEPYRLPSVKPEQTESLQEPESVKKSSIAGNFVTVVTGSQLDNSNKAGQDKKEDLPQKENYSNEKPQSPSTTVQKESSTDSIPASSAKKPVPPEPFKKTYLFDYAKLDEREEPVQQDRNFDPNHIYIENPDAQDEYGRTKLMKAAKEGDLETLENLIYSDCSMNIQDKDGWTAIMFASRFCSKIEILQSLLKNGADAKIKNNYGISPLSLAASYNKNSEITKELLNLYSVSESEVRNTFINAVIQEASAETLKLFLKKGLNINSSYNGKTPLMYAAETNKSTSTIKFLLDNGAKTGYRTENGMSAFDFARNNRRIPKDNYYWALNTGSN